MNRSELCAHVAAAASLSRADAAFAIDAMLLAISDALARDETVSIAGFGKFTTKRRAARKGRNPRTGEAVAIAASWVPAFKAGKALRESVNEYGCVGFKLGARHRLPLRAAVAPGHEIVPPGTRPASAVARWADSAER